MLSLNHDNAKGIHSSISLGSGYVGSAGACNEEFLEDELSEENYYEKLEPSPPSPIPGFGVNDKWCRVIGRKNDS